MFPLKYIFCSSLHLGIIPIRFDIPSTKSITYYSIKTNTILIITIRFSISISIVLYCLANKPHCLNLSPERVHLAVNESSAHSVLEYEKVHRLPQYWEIFITSYGSRVITTVLPSVNKTKTVIMIITSICSGAERTPYCSACKECLWIGPDHLGATEGLIV